MKSSYQVLLTETSIVVLSKGTFQTSIPLRQWSTLDGSTWSGLLRQGHQIEWLVGALNDALNDPTTESTMQRVHRVLANSSMPPRVPSRPKRTGAAPVAAVDESTTNSPVRPSRAPSRPRRNREVPPTQSAPSIIEASLHMSV